MGQMCFNDERMINSDKLHKNCKVWALLVGFRNLIDMAVFSVKFL